MGYIYETHLHTAGPSRCGQSSGEEQAKFIKEQGYAGMFVTDHFFNGNSGVDRELPWPERVAEYMRGYEEAKAWGDANDFDVFFGIEWNFKGDEYLLYGVSKEWLLEYPRMLEWSHSRLFEEINKIGGLMVQAHPFRDRPYINTMHLHPEHVHAIELVNAGNSPYNESMAAMYAKHFGFRTTAGSDLHRNVLPERGLKGVISPYRLKSPMDYVELIKSGDYELNIKEEDVLPLEPDVRAAKPIDMTGYNGEDRTSEIIELIGDRFMPSIS